MKSPTHTSCAVLASAVTAAATLAQPAYRVSVETPRPGPLEAALAAEGFAVDCGARVGEGSLEIIVSQSEFDRLAQLGLQPTILDRARPFSEIQTERALAAQAAGLDVPQGYPTLAEVIDSLNATAAAYPQIARVIDLQSEFGAPMTHEGRRIHAIKISDNVNQTEDEPTFLLVSEHHAREIVTPVLALGAIDRLTSGYGSDPAITSVVDENEIYIIPCHNPDGYEYVFNVNMLWRKNRRNNGGGDFGVDLNRNYPQGWSASCSGSGNPGSDTYKGPGPGSEPETQALMEMSEALRFAKVLDYHSFGRETLHGYSCSSHPLEQFWQNEAQAISQAHGYGGDNRPPSAEGESYQWIFANFGTHAFLTETHTEFQPPFTSAESEEALTWPGVLHLLQRPVSVIGNVTDGLSGSPLEAAISVVGMNLQNGETNTSGGPFGRYQVTLPIGPYTLEFSAPGYQTQTRTVNVTASSSQRLDIELVVEALALSLIQGPPALVAPGEATPVEVEILAGAQQLEPGSAKLRYRAAPGAFAEIPLAPLGGGIFTANLPGPSCGTNPEFYVEAMGDGGALMTLPAGAPAQTFSYGVGVLETRFADNFQMSTGWTAENLGASSGDWDRGVPVNDPGWEYDPASDSDGSGACLLTQNDLGNTDVDGGAVRITSPEFDLSGEVDISYDYYLNLTNPAGTDFLIAEVSTGGPWIEVARHGTDGGLSWRSHTITAAQLASAGVSGTPTTRIRFTANDANPQSIVEGGVDAFSVSAISCDSCYADCTGEGSLDIFDFICFQDAFASADPYADCNNSGTFDIFDFICFQDAFATGCP